MNNLLWILAIVITIILYTKDASLRKKIKTNELKIYEIKVRDLAIKKEVSRIRGEALPDYLINKQIEEPSEFLTLPKMYYFVLIGINIIIRIILNW